MTVLAIDFGTSNTAAAVSVAGKPYIIPLEAAQETLPTAIFLDYIERQTLIGHAAVNALIAGREGRFMRALKSVLGTSLMREKRQFMNERLSLIEIVGRFLAQVKAEAETHCRMSFDRVLSGRPVHFHTDSKRDAQALSDLRACYMAAGFKNVEFLPEPEAAALASGEGEGYGLVVDIGGGTSDFTVFRRSSGATEMLASHGIRLGGTDFDRLVSLAHVMPLLGKGTDLRAEMGPEVHEAPVSVFYDLATWAAIPFLYTNEVRRDVAQMAKLAVEPEKFSRLVSVLEMELGHDIAFAVERGKIATNKPEPGWGMIDLSALEPALKARLVADDLRRVLNGSADRIRSEATTTLEMAGISEKEIERIVFVGGSSLMGSVSDSIIDLLPGAEPVFGSAFTGIVDGLALATNEMSN